MGCNAIITKPKKKSKKEQDGPYYVKIKDITKVLPD